jgi:hypothetical protein
MDEQDKTSFPKDSDWCSSGCHRPAKLVKVCKTSVGDVPLYLCKYCKAWDTRIKNKLLHSEIIKIERVK